MAGIAILFVNASFGEEIDNPRVDKTAGKIDGLPFVATRSHSPVSILAERPPLVTGPSWWAVRV